MKNGIDYYRHMVHSHSNYKFKMLRTKYGWAGEGRFWALNNLIGQAKDCVLDLANKSIKVSVAGELDMGLTELEEFIEYLKNDCDNLVLEKDGKITTRDVQEVYDTVGKKRARDRQAYQTERELGEYEKRLSGNGKPVSADENDNSADGKPVSADEMLIDELRDGLTKWYGFSELNHFARFREVTMFLNVLRNGNKLSHFKDQFYFYRKLKKEANEKRHGFAKFLGTPEKKYEDGAWNLENWKKKYKEWYEGTNPEEPVKVRRAG